MPDVIEGTDDLALSTISIEARRWVRIQNLVAVVADLKNSTALRTHNATRVVSESSYLELDASAGTARVQGSAGKK
ncbi:MAG: hypothetical protein R3A49_12455 [Acidimicrobiia bacterium]